MRKINYPINNPDFIPATFQMPRGRVVINKGKTGCGFTTFCLKDYPGPLILCVPRLFLAYNKYEQTPGTHIYKPKDSKEKTEALQGGLLLYIQSNPTNAKIIVTYDSFGKVKEVIRKWEGWQVVVDEFQCLVSDSAFKRNIELDFIEQLRDLPNVAFVSAAPYDPTFLDRIEYFAGMDYISLDWPADSIPTPIIKTRPMKSPLAVFRELKERYDKTGSFEVKIEDGKLYRAKECYIFLNSLRDIRGIIRDNHLTPDQVNIICSSSKTNDLPTGFSLGTVPGKNETPKTYTFITRAAFEGIDLYSPSSATYIFADQNIESMALDISTDIVQVMGRQRLKTNPFQNQATIFYKDGRRFDKKAYREMIKGKEKGTTLGLKLYTKATMKEKEWLREKIAAGGNEDYLTVYKGEVMIYELLRACELRTLLIQNQLYSSQLSSSPTPDLSDEYYQFIKDGSKWKDYVRLRKKWGDVLLLFTDLSSFHEPYNTLGPDVIRRCEYRADRIQERYDKLSLWPEVEGKMKEKITSPSILTNQDLRDIIQQVYDEVGFPSKASASDITKVYPEAVRAKINNQDGYKI